MRDLQTQGRRQLEASGIESAALDSALLLAGVLGLTREALLARTTDPVSAEDQSKFLEWIARRATGYPVAYLLGVKEFRGLEFKVDERVLIPRPDTEILVEAALELLPKLGKKPQVLDLCTGSGCVGISLMHEYKDLEVYLGDLSAPALDLARENALRLLGRELFAFQTDLLQNVPSALDMIVANPPYLTPDETVSCLAQGWKEPEMALNGQGPEGLLLIKRLIIQAKKRMKNGSYLLIEAAPSQMEAMTLELEKNRLKPIGIREDLAGHDRVLIAQYVKL